MADTGEHWPAAELYRVQAELSAAQGGDGARAQSSFEEALQIARAQRARSWELKVLTAASQHSHDRTRRDVTRRSLKDMYDWFSERAPDRRSDRGTGRVAAR